MSNIDDEIAKIDKKKQELEAQKAREILEEEHKKIKRIFLPGIINITDPKIIDGCGRCNHTEISDGQGYCDDSTFCTMGGGKIHGNNHPIGANFTLNCPFLHNSKQTYIESLEAAKIRIDEILAKVKTMKI